LDFKACCSRSRSFSASRLVLNGLEASNTSAPYRVLVLHYQPRNASLHRDESPDMALILVPDSIGRSERAHPAGYRNDRHIGSGKPHRYLFDSIGDTFLET
jgi:hypothetical protein